MTLINRRKFIYSTALITGVPGILSSMPTKTAGKSGSTANNILVGVISSANDPEKELKIVKDLGFQTCQLSVGTFSPGLAKQLSTTLDKYQIKPVSLICSGPGTYRYNFTEGPATIGLVPGKTGLHVSNVLNREWISARQQGSLPFRPILVLFLKIRKTYFISSLLKR